MNLQAKTPRKRVANFSPHEKALLGQLIKKRPIVESKLTDGKSVAKKQAAWDLITQEFNFNENVTKRGTITLKRAWDNMKAFARKARATERTNLIRTRGGTHTPPPQHSITSMVEDAAHVMKCGIKNSFDSDSSVLYDIDNSQEPDPLIENSNEQTPISIETLVKIELSEEKEMDSEENTMFVVQESPETNCPQIEDMQINTDQTGENYSSVINTKQVRRRTDYIRREAVMRLKHLENKKNMEVQILKTQLEVQEIKKKAAVLEEERNKILLEKAKVELDNVLKQTTFLN